MAVAGAVNTAMMAAVSEAVNAPTAQVTSTGMELSKENSNAMRWLRTYRPSKTMDRDFFVRTTSMVRRHLLR